MISQEHQCIFVHIPKTAGNSVNRVFGVGWQDHKDLQRYRDELPAEDFARYFKFAIVRNPWDRLFSDYNYQLKKSREKDSKLFLFTPTGSKRNFAEWVEVALAAPDFYAPQRWGGAVSAHIHRWSPQADWISLDDRPAVDFVAHLERLSEDFPVVCERLGLPPVRLPHRNRRLHLHYSHYYDATTRSVVAAYYARDIELFGYEFHHALLRVSFAWPAARPASGEPATAAGSEIAGTEFPASTRTFSFPTGFRTGARRVLFSRSLLALAASAAIFVLTFTAATTTESLASGQTQSFMQHSFRQVIAAYPGSSRRSGAPLIPAARASRGWRDLHLALQPSPAAVLGFTPILLAIPPESSSAPAARRVSAPPPVEHGPASGPSPRWWWNRRLEN